MKCESVYISTTVSMLHFAKVGKKSLPDDVDCLVVESTQLKKNHTWSIVGSFTLNEMFLIMTCRSNRLFESALLIIIYPDSRDEGFIQYGF